MMGLNLIEWAFVLSLILAGAGAYYLLFRRGK